MLRKYFLVVLLGSLFFCGCKKLPTSYYYLTEFDRSLAKFQVGSYWIYQNDSTLLIDSIHVTSFKDKMINNPDDDYENALAYSQEYIVIEMKSTLFPDSEITFMIGAGRLMAFANYYFPTFDSYFQITNSNNEFTFYESDSSNYIIQHSTLNVNNTTYNNVAEIFNTIHPYYSVSNYVIKTLVIPNVGLIKWNQQYLDSPSVSESWSLVRYHMVW